MALDGAAAQRILDDAALETEKIQKLFVNGRCPREHQVEALERLTRLKDEWQENQGRLAWDAGRAHHASSGCRTQRAA
jgi:hypothetical protein